MGLFSKKTYHILCVKFISNYEKTYFILGEGDNGLKRKIQVMMEFQNPNVNFISFAFWDPDMGPRHNRGGWGSTSINKNTVEFYDFAVTNKI
jgi:hypothetical protein